ncbi:MAG: hypothetical protein U0X92_07605 [Anaerolineales bacterium]
MTVTAQAQALQALTQTTLAPHPQQSRRSALRACIYSDAIYG